jgi:hypothetical protein
MKFHRIEGCTNIRAAIQDGKLLLKIDLEKEGEPSSSGYSTIIAKSGRFVSLADLCDGREIGLNLILTEKIKKEKKNVKKNRKDDD